MSQESSSTQLCEVLIDCYQDKEKKNHDQTGHDTRSKKTDCNESDEDPLQKHLNAPFTLLRRPASNTNEISFQFGKAKKANFDFTGRGKELRGTRCGGSADEIGGRFRGMRDAESIGNLSATRPPQTEKVEPSPSTIASEKDWRKASKFSVAEHRKTLQDEESVLPKGISTCEGIASNKQKLSQEPVFHEANSMTNYESRADQDGEPKKTTSPLEFLEKSVYFESLSNSRNKESDDNSDKSLRPKVTQGELSSKYQDVIETEAKTNNPPSQPKQPNNPSSEPVSTRYPRFNLLANRMKNNDRKIQRGQSDEKILDIESNKVLEPRHPARINKKTSINRKTQQQIKKSRYDDNPSRMSSLQTAIDDVIREAYAEKLNAFTIEREHFVAQVAALKTINSNLNSDLSKANQLHHQSTEGLKRLKDKISARSEQVKELKILTDEMKSDLIENRCAFKDVQNLYEGTKNQLKNALSSQESFSEASKRTSNLIFELKESVGHLVALELNNRHLHEQVEEKNTRLLEETERRSALDQQMQRIISEHSNVAEINTLVTNLSQRLEEVDDNVKSTKTTSSSEDNLKLCLQAIRSLEEQQKFHSGYVMHAGAELQNLSRSVPIELQRIERLFLDGPWKLGFIGKLEERFTEMKTQLASLTSTKEQLFTLNEATQLLQQQCSVKESEIVKLKAASESQDIKYQIASNKVELLETEIANNKQLSEHKDSEISRLKEVESSSTSLQHDLNIAIKEKARLATTIGDKSLAEASLRGDLERLQNERIMLEEKIRGFDQEKLNIETKASETFKKQKEDLEADVQRLFAEKLHVLESKLFNSNQEGDKLQLALDNTCEELVDLKLKNKELSDKLQAKEDTVQGLVVDLHAKDSVSESATANLNKSANELRNKDQIIKNLANNKEKAEAEVQILREELQAFKLRLVDEQRANEVTELELANLKKATVRIHSPVVENIDNVKKNYEKGEGARETVEWSRGQVASDISPHAYENKQQYPPGSCPNLTSREDDENDEPQREQSGQGRLKVSEDERYLDGRFSEGTNTGILNNEVHASGQWPEQIDNQLSLLDAGATNVEDKRQPIEIAQGNEVLADDNDLISYFHSSNFSSGLLGTPSLFNLYTNKEQSLLPRNGQNPTTGEVSGIVQNEISLNQQEEAVSDSQMDVRTFSDFRREETAAMAPSSISALSDLDITTPEDFSTRPGPASMNRGIEENVSPRPRSSNMSARRRPSKSSPSLKGSDISSEHIRNVGPEDVFQIDRKRPHPNTASKLKTNIFRGRGDGRIPIEADCCLGGDGPNDCGENKKRRLDKTPYLMNQFARDSSSLPLRGAGLVSEATGSTSRAGKNRVSKSQPRIKRILNWASMYSGVQQQNNSEANKGTTSVLEQKMKMDKQQISESNDNRNKNNSHVKESRTQSGCLIQPRSKAATQRNQRKNILIEKSLTPQDAKASLSAAKFERLQRSSSTHVSATPGRVGGKNGTGAGRTKRRRISKNNRYSFRFSQETSKM